jgi:cytochrome c-type biogenesis protein CcmH
MALFWAAAAVLASGAGLLVMLFSRAGAAGQGRENPALGVHRRQLFEIDELADRGVLNREDQAAARAEAARRLLSQSALKEDGETAGSARSRLIALAAAAAAALGALGLYLVLGAPGDPDQPYLARVEQWRKANPATLGAPELVAVLQTIARDRPNDPEVFNFLGRAEGQAGDPYGAAKAFERAAHLAPSRPEFDVLEGEALMDANAGKGSPEAEAAFAKALALDPRSLPARYSLGRIEIEQGRRQAGLGLWKGILASLPEKDPRRPVFAAEIDRVAAGGEVDAPAGPPSGEAADAQAFIRGMVASLAARLKTHPDDPEGWSRLVRSYGVLHDKTAQTDALARARQALAGRPKDLAPIEAEARSHPA